MPGIVVMIPRFAIEPVAAALENWVKWLRIGTLSASIGTIKGSIVPMAQGVYYDREALIDAHAIWESFGEGEGEYKKRKVTVDKNDNGTVVREEVVFRDPREFARAMRAFVSE